MPGILAVALADLLGGTISGRTIQFLRMLAS
jgi:hypothetical protein